MIVMELDEFRLLMEYSMPRLGIAQCGGLYGDIEVWGAL